MSQSVPPGLEGHIESPNPLELFWEKNKRLIYFGAVAVAVALLINYYRTYKIQQATDELWSGFAASTGLDHGYADNGKLWEIYSSRPDQQAQWYGYYLSSTQRELISDLGEDLQADSSTRLEQELERTKGTGAEPLVLWMLATRAIEDEDWTAAKARLNDLKSRFPMHFLCVESDYPVQWRKSLEEKKDEEATAPKKRRDEPKLADPKPGSEVGELLAQIDRQEKFRAEHPRLYEPVAPDSTETIVFVVETGGREELSGEIKIKLYSTAAPKHTEALLALARSEIADEQPFWVGQAIHEIQRAPAEASPFAGPAPSELRFGLPSSKEADTTKWIPGEVPVEHVVEWEDNDLSHFEGMVAVETAPEGKSQVERIVINAGDVAAQQDGQRVIVGRVVEGLDLVRRLVDDALLASDAEERQGRGKPADRITIKSVRVE